MQGQFRQRWLCGTWCPRAEPKEEATWGGKQGTVRGAAPDSSSQPMWAARSAGRELNLGRQVRASPHPVMGPVSPSLRHEALSCTVLPGSEKPGSDHFFIPISHDATQRFYIHYVQDFSCGQCVGSGGDGVWVTYPEHSWGTVASICWELKV